MKKILAIALLSVAITACESNTADNANAAKPANTPASTPTLATPTTEASPAAKVELKAGDKVKVMMNGVGRQNVSSEAIKFFLESESKVSVR